MEGTRYKPFRLPKSVDWGVLDKNRKRFLLGVICEDEAAAAALSFTLNKEYLKWLASGRVTPEVPEPQAVIVPYIFRRASNRYSVSDDPVPRQPVRSAAFRLADYAERAPESERRLISRLAARA